MKQYSPPRLTTKPGMPAGGGGSGCFGTVLRPGHYVLALDGALKPVQEHIDADEQDGVVDVGVPLGFEGLSPQQPPPVVEDHVPRVPQPVLALVAGSR
jgi:hypothetical protein